MSEHSHPRSRARRLSEIVREVKVAAAERDDVVVEMRDSDRARLELLAQELQPVVDDIPSDDDQFDVGLSVGLQPRLWIDAVAHVHMGRDRRTYRFVRDTRLGRSIVSETADKDTAADAVSRYIAERLIQRQRLLEGDFETLHTVHADRSEPPRERERAQRVLREASAVRERQAAAPAQAATAPQPPLMPMQPVPAERRDERSRTVIFGLIWFFVGCIIGGLVLMAAFADRFAG